MSEQDFTLDFGDALRKLKDGHRLTRLDRSWGGRFICLVDGISVPAIEFFSKEFSSPTKYIHHDKYICCYHWNGTCSVWIPTMEDLLAEDWIMYN